MKTLSICVFIAMCLVMKGSSEVIKCYVCDNCDVLDGTQLRTCPSQDPTDSPNTDNPTTPFESSSKPTDESTLKTTVSPIETVATTLSTKPTVKETDSPNTDQPITEETRKTETTAVQTEETESSEPKTTAASVPSETTTKFHPSTNEPNPSTQGSSGINNPTNVISEVFKPSSTSSEVIPEVTAPVEETAPSIVATSVVSTGSPEILSAVTIAPEASHSMINLYSPAQAPSSQSSMSEAVNFIAPAPMAQTSQYNKPYQIINRIPRGVRNLRSTPSYHCYSIDMIDGDTRKVKKGCVEVPEEKSACEVLKKEFGKSVGKCKICTEDKCNSSSTLKYSLITLVMVLVISVY